MYNITYLFMMFVTVMYSEQRPPMKMRLVWMGRGLRFVVVYLFTGDLKSQLYFYLFFGF